MPDLDIADPSQAADALAVVQPTKQAPKSHQERPGFTGDRVLRNSQIFMLEFGWWIEMAWAVPEGDIGRVWEILKIWIFKFAGSSHQNYMKYLLELYCFLRYESSPALHDAVFDNLLLKVKSELGKCIPADLHQEHYIRWLKDMSRRHGGEFDEPFFRKTISPNVDHFLRFKEDIETAFSLKRRSKAHTSPSQRPELTLLLTLFREEEAHLFREGRSMGHAAVNQFSRGCRQLEEGKLTDFISTTTCLGDFFEAINCKATSTPNPDADTSPERTVSPTPPADRSASPTPSASNSDGQPDSMRSSSPVPSAVNGSQVYVEILDQTEKELVDAGARGRHNSEGNGGNSEGDKRESGSKMRRVDDSKLPWVVNDFHLEATLSPELARTRSMLLEFANDPNYVLGTILNSIRHDALPESEWLAIVKGYAVDLNKSIAYSLVTKTVFTYSEWLTVFTKTAGATVFVFPHRRQEVDVYRRYIALLSPTRSPAGATSSLVTAGLLDIGNEVSSATTEQLTSIPSQKAKDALRRPRNSGSGSAEGQKRKSPADASMMSAAHPTKPLPVTATSVLAASRTILLPNAIVQLLFPSNSEPLELRAKRLRCLRDFV
ncbi:hypothetical protein MVEN_00046600 [Mycena venus]|uniref:DUF6589 domain-containing protein n=1 Tax=Mycena venus TaxID=2733690 RepID=A0A8H7DG50_9AGAR|nr:hypothetical protein MVEN_00046600 [Mycena venus]